jgi:hypothetical protein
MRGYAGTKAYEADAARTVSAPLLRALSDFRQSKNLDPDNRKASVAVQKICKYLSRRVSGSWVDAVGSIFILIFAVAVFTFAQLDFFLEGTPLHKWLKLPWPGVIKDAPTYSLLTFGSLLFMIAGLYLPKVLKLKVPGIELEKATIDQVSAPSTLGISRSGSLTD